MTYLHALSHRFGSGDLLMDFVVLAIALGVFVTVVLVEQIAQQRRTRREIDRLDRVAGVAGRVEKLEMTLNTFRSESVRSGQILRSELQNVAADITELLKVTGGTPSTPPAAGGTSTKLGTGTETEPEPEPGEDLSAPREIDPFAPSEIELTAEPEPESAAAPEAPAAEVEALVPGAVEAPVPSEGGVPASSVVEMPPDSLTARLRRTRAGLWGKVRGILSGAPQVSAEALDEIEAQLIGSDLGAKMVGALITQAKAELKLGKVLTESALVEALKTRVLSILCANAPIDPEIHPKRQPDGPLIVMMVGVNGVGKTTTTAKLAGKWKAQGAKVLLVAADTFRAAAVEQLVQWGKELDVPVVHGAADAKPATVVFDAMERAKWENFDVVIIDTAGRLHTKTNLMQELEGIRNIIRRHQPSAPHELLLVLDGATGQNALSQAREFHSALALTGLVITKLDGTPRGGIVVAIKDELNIPVRFIGVGEAADDLRPFIPEEFVQALFDAKSGLSGDEEQPGAHAAERRRKRRDQAGDATIH